MNAEQKMILAVVRPYLLDRIVVALEEIEDLPGMTVWDSAGFSSRLRSDEFAIDPFRPNKTIVVVADPDLAVTIADTIRKQAATGRKGDGIVIVCPVDSAALI